MRWRIGKIFYEEVSPTVLSSLSSQMRSVPEDYLKISDLLKLMKASFEEVESFVLIEKVEEIRQKYNALIGILKRKLLKSFREIGQVRDQ